VEKIDKVNGEVEGMLEGWGGGGGGIEEGGRSLKDACERLLEERVRWVPYFLTTVLKLDTTGSFTRTNGQHRDATRVFQGIGIRNAYAQAPG
jgi:hypothetical protein